MAKRIPKLDPKMKEAVEAAYQLGKIDGSDRLQYRLELLKKTNAALWDELCTLDKIEPINNITISVEDAQKIILALTNKKREYQGVFLARKLRKLVKNAQKGLVELYSKFCQESQFDIPSQNS